MTVLVDLANASEQESDAGVLQSENNRNYPPPDYDLTLPYLVPDDGQQLALNSRVESHLFEDLSRFFVDLH